MDENFRSSTYLNEEPQLQLLYQVKTKILDFFGRIAKKEHSMITKEFGSWYSLTAWKNCFYSPTPTKEEKEIFTPLDVKIMREIRDKRKDQPQLEIYCFENKKEPLLNKNKNNKITGLNTSGPILCLTNGLSEPITLLNVRQDTKEGGNKRKKTKSKRNARKIANKSIKKYNK